MQKLIFLLWPYLSFTLRNGSFFHRVKFILHHQSSHIKLLPMKQLYKLVASFILVFYLVPVGTGFCCCTEFEVSGKSIAHSESGANGGQYNCHHHGGKSNAPHSHDECKHGEILADLTQQAFFDTSLHSSSLSKVSFRSLLTGVFTAVGSNHSPSPLSFLHETGPPGGFFSLNPNFLEVLRI